MYTYLQGRKRGVVKQEKKKDTEFKEEDVKRKLGGKSFSIIRSL